MKGVTSGTCSITKDTGYNLEFNILSVDLSIVNAIRRTILSNIPTGVFRTLPYELDKCVVYKNTTIMNNEILKHRLSGVVIHTLHNADESYLNSIIMELNMENTTDQYTVVTTKDFKIKDKTSGTYLPEADVRKIFPPSAIVLDAFGIESFTDLVKLRPRLQELPGDVVHLTCEFSLGTAYEDSQYNVVSTCAYSHLRDDDLVRSAFDEKRRELEKLDLTPDEISYKLKDWMLLDSYRYIRKNDFEFIVETLGSYTNKQLVTTAVDIILYTLNAIETVVEIQPGNLETEYKILIHKDDYTIGKLLEIALYNAYFEDRKVLKYCGFKKTHPHDLFAVVRIDYINKIEGDFQSTILRQIKDALQPTINTFLYIKSQFVE